MNENIAKNYSLILKDIVSYLPSRVLITLNSIIIIPIFAHTLNTKQMSIYLITIQILNFILTCTFDWITKAVLRFHEKYRYKGQLNSLFSGIFWISTVTYILTFLSYFLFKDIVSNKFAIDNLTFLLTILLVIPCSIRQFLYQILRIKNLAKLYTLSIVLYQLGFIALFLVIFHLIPNATAILTAMSIAMFLIDMYIIRVIKLNYEINLTVDKSIIAEVLKYAIPLVITNSCYWYILNAAKLIFQNGEEYLNTAIVGTAWMLANSITPFMTVFIFTTFPTIVKQFELKLPNTKQYYTNMLQLYCFILIPLISTFYFFPKELTAIILPKDYSPVAYILPFFAIAVFLHELMKLINIKYHLKIKTHIEMIIAGAIALSAYFLNLTFIHKFAILGAGIALFLTEIALILVNIFVGNKNSNYVNYKKLSKTFLSVNVIGGICFLILHNATCGNALKLALYIVMSSTICLCFRKRILA